MRAAESFVFKTPRLESMAVPKPYRTLSVNTNAPGQVSSIIFTQSNCSTWPTVLDYLHTRCCQCSDRLLLCERCTCGNRSFLRRMLMLKRACHSKDGGLARGHHGESILPMTQTTGFLADVFVRISGVAYPGFQSLSLVYG